MFEPTRRISKQLLPTLEHAVKEQWQYFLPSAQLHWGADWRAGDIAEASAFVIVHIGTDFVLQVWREGVSLRIRFVRTSPER